MIATHVLVARTPDGDLALWQSIAGGRASALFAVLAGVSLTLGSGWARRDRRPTRAERVVQLLVRALLIGALGLVLGGLDSGLAVILSYYAMLFVLAVPFLEWSARRLAVAAAVWVVLAPVLSHLVRPFLPDRGVDSPNLDQLSSPGELLAELFLTGYYPAFVWMAYLLAGMALGRLDLRRWQVAGAVAAGGAVLASAAKLISDEATRQADTLRALTGSASGEQREQFLDGIAGGMFGTTPAGETWHWLWVSAPHSGTPFDLAHTIGTSLLVLGVSLLVVAMLPAGLGRVLQVLTGAGAMTLSLYTLHVVMRTPQVWPAEEPDAIAWHLLVVLGIGAGFAVAGRRGPAEAVVRWVSRAAGGLASR